MSWESSRARTIPRASPPSRGGDPQQTSFLRCVLFHTLHLSLTLFLIVSSSFLVEQFFVAFSLLFNTASACLFSAYTNFKPPSAVGMLLQKLKIEDSFSSRLLRWLRFSTLISTSISKVKHRFTYLPLPLPLVRSMRLNMHREQPHVPFSDTKKLNLTHSYNYRNTLWVWQLVHLHQAWTLLGKLMAETSGSPRRLMSAFFNGMWKTPHSKLSTKKLRSSRWF